MKNILYTIIFLFLIYIPSQSQVNTVCANDTIKLKIETVFVQGGTFMMGSPDDGTDYSAEHPQHAVTLDSFYIGKYEVTKAQFAAFLNAQGNQTEGGVTWYDTGSSYARIDYINNQFVPEAGFENHPVIEVTWYGARAYATWVGGRLPTEAEWEYAARGGNQSQGYTYSGSNDINAVAWYYTVSTTHLVGTKQGNELGLYDMSGNVWEWCNDWYSSTYYSTSPQNNPQGPDTGSYHLLRGGSWHYDANYCRVADRSYYHPVGSNYYYGFRVAF
jgi:formylglycine-generating enzyme required for sulfatase activity